MKANRESEALLCAVRRDDPSGDRLLEALGAGINWPRLLDLSVRHKVMPLLCARLQALGERNPAPLEIMARLKTLRRLNEGKNLIMLGKLAEILDIFGRNGIEAIVLKGPVLAVAAYGSIGMRQFDDLDILIRPRDHARIKSLMANLGFRPNVEGTRAQEAEHFRRYYGSEFIDTRGKAFVEFKTKLTDLLNQAELETENLFARKEIIMTEGMKLFSLSAEDALIHLCFHGTRHIWPLLGMISDLAAFVASRDDWPWEGLLERAQKAGLRRNLFLGLMLAGEAAGLELPAEVEREAKTDAVAARLKEQILGDLFWDRINEVTYLELALHNLKRRERISDKMSFILRRLVGRSPMDWKTIPLPDRLFSLYIPLRVIRLLATLVFPGLGVRMNRDFRNREARRRPDSG
jgi:hypothetical protein